MAEEETSQTSQSQKVILGVTCQVRADLSQAEVTGKVPSLPWHGPCHQRDPYHTLILDYDRETPQCHTDKGEGFFPLYEPVSF